MSYLLYAILFSPLFAACFNGILCRSISNKIASIVASTGIVLSALCASIVFVKAGINKEIAHVVVFNWITIEDLYINWSIYVDQLTGVMFLLVTFVSCVVHIYSLGYMSDDKNLPKFLSYLSLFTFFMLALVSADNFLQLFFGWEGVGLCSYLLIGYYYQKKSANNAAIKAFIVNRVGDLAFIIGIVLILIHTQSLEFKTVFIYSKDLSTQYLSILGYHLSIIDVICFMLFLGCMGKSAQIGMHVWLPDAMEGPTPVSALIHAATMVTAGVFLVVRCSFMFEYSPLTLEFITIIGAVTCLFAAVIAVMQNDIKKIIAYSTCSQLGYMFFACGVSAYQVAMFHLVTHGFFKALLFLSAGSVIHACHEQDIFKMGGIWKKMPVTYANFWIGSLAIVGIFPFAGFYSKDLILESAYLAGGIGQMAFEFGIIAALLTAVYSVKIIVLTFHGKTRMDNVSYNKVHESPNIMNIPLFVLTAGALFSGMFGFYILEINSPYGFFSGVIFNKHISDHEHHISVLIQLLPMIVGFAGGIWSFWIYKTNIHKLVRKLLSPIHYIISNKFFVDEVYNYVFVIPLYAIGRVFSVADNKIIDRCGPGAIAYLVSFKSKVISKMHNGYIFTYVFYIMFSIVIVITYFVLNFIQTNGGV